MEDAYVLQLSKSKFKDFYLCFCGYAECDPLHSYGPAVRPNYIIHHILSGKGTYQVGERKYELSKGQGFLIEPETLTFYQADAKDPWVYLWIGFDGHNVPKVLQDVGLNSNQLVYQCDHGQELKEIVLSTLQHAQASNSDLYFLQAQLYHFFSVLTRDVVIDSYDTSATENLHIQRAVTYIRNNYSKGITVADMSRDLNISRGHLYTIFKETINISPKEFLTKFRISRAKEQLTLTNLPIEYIALSCGYNNTLVFTKAFKQLLGLTPTQYRKQNRTETQEHLTASQSELESIIKKNNIIF